MSSFEEAANIFETTFSRDDYFDSMSAEFAQNALEHIIEENRVGMLFLLGNPGVGKTYMLHRLKERFTSKRRIIMAEEPFDTPEALLHFLLSKSMQEERRALQLSELKERAMTLYGATPHLIMIDEAQLLGESVLEYIRILNDSNQFRFVLSMHQNEGEAILKKPHFASREHRVVILGVLKSDEIKNYVESQLLRHQLGDIGNLFMDKQLQAIAHYTQGNFRMVKQMLKRIFMLMDYAKKHAYDAYVTPNRCVVTMAAIDLGCIDA